MGAPLRPVRVAPGSAWLLPAGLFALPLTAALAWALADALDPLAWQQLLAAPALAPSLRLALWVGSASTLLSLGLTLWLVAQLQAGPAWARLEPALGGLLAIPHAAFAVGLALLLMPSGLIARLIAPLAGWLSPPDLATVQDPFGLALIAALVLKEVPFLLWNVAAQLRPVASATQLRQQLQTAQTLGYPAASVWWRVLWPQLLPRLALPLLAVWAYGLTVVDMALVLGPTRPPTLAVLAWQWLLDADATMNRQGAAAALLLAGLTAAGALLATAIWRLMQPALRAREVRGDRPTAGSAGPGAALLVLAGVAAYACAIALLLFVSIASVWRFPALWPQQVSLDAWGAVATGLRSVGVTAGLALASAATGVALAIAWMEITPEAWDRRAAPLVFAPMLLPGVLLVVGLYRLALELRLDGSLTGLWLSHSLFTAPYALVALAPAYRSFDARYEHTAMALGRSRLAFLSRVKWPMLLAPIAWAAAIGFAVSVTQYLSTQFVGAGRHATLTTEALTLASGGQRGTMAAFALLQTLLPALAFGAAWGLARAQARRIGAPAVV